MPGPVSDLVQTGTNFSMVRLADEAECRSHEVASAGALVRPRGGRIMIAYRSWFSGTS